jgi:hypothetical protein
MNPKREYPVDKKALPDALLELDGRAATSTSEGRVVADRVLRRDRLRVRILTGATIALFLLALVGIYGSFSYAKTDIYSKIFQCSDEVCKQGKGFSGVQLNTLTLLQDAYMILFKIVLMDSVALVAILVAAVCTVLLILTTRRATLRQIQASLLLLSDQVETMRRSREHP